MSDLATNGSTATSGPTEAKKVRVDEALAEERDFDADTQKALEEIDNTQNEIDVLNENASEEILKVEQKYNELRKPYYDKRNEIIAKIPKFWLTAFINHPEISSVIEQDEEDALQHLNKLEVEEFEDIKSGYRISLFFGPNSYFENAVLVKEFHHGATGEPTSKSTSISWKEGRDLSVKMEKSTAAGASKSGKRALKTRSFFSWFSDNTDPTEDDIAEVIKDDLWYVETFERVELFCFKIEIFLGQILFSIFSYLTLKWKTAEMKMMTMKMLRTKKWENRYAKNLDHVARFC
jgi:template-activating factor I